MTGQSILNMMEILDPELQLQSGESDVTKGLLTLNMAQDYFEALAAGRVNIKGSSVGTVTTTASTETTAYPTGLYRLDRLQYLDSNSNIMWDLGKIQRVGGHRGAPEWPLSTLTSGSGAPKKYWTNARLIYWAPLPDATYTVRWYGFQGVADITADGTFLYDDIVALPLASFAVQLWKTGLDDPAQDFGKLAVTTFKSTLDILESHNRDGAKGFDYTERHIT